MNVQIKPDITNWRQFCAEEPLTEQEYAAWKQMASAIKQNDGLFDIIAAETEAELAVFHQREPFPTSDWMNAVKWADAFRALQRAEIRAYQEWKRRTMLSQTTPPYRDQNLRSFTGSDPEPIEAATEILRPGGKLCYWGKEANHDQ